MNFNKVHWNFSDNGTKESAKSRFWKFYNFWTAWNFLMRFSLLCSGEWALSFYMCVFIYIGVSLNIPALNVDISLFNIWATSWGTIFLPYANNKSRDQPVHLRSLISAFVVSCLDNTTTFYSRNFKTLASLCSWAGRFESNLVANPKDRFCRDEAHIYKRYFWHQHL